MTDAEWKAAWDDLDRRPGEAEDAYQARAKAIRASMTADWTDQEKHEVAQLCKAAKMLIGTR